MNELTHNEREALAQVICDAFMSAHDDRGDVTTMDLLLTTTRKIGLDDLHAELSEIREECGL